MVLQNTHNIFKKKLCHKAAKYFRESSYFSPVRKLYKNNHINNRGDKKL